MPLSPNPVCQVVCDAIIWRYPIHKTFPLGGYDQKVVGRTCTAGRSNDGGPSIEVSRGCVGGDGVVENSRRLGDGIGGSTAAAMEQGGVCGLRSVRVPTDNRKDANVSKRPRVGPGSGAGPTEQDEESFHRHFALETPLQQVRTTLFFGLKDGNTAQQSRLSSFTERPNKV